MRFDGDKAKADAVYKGVEPLTPDDIAEYIVFATGRRENVVLADTLIFPNHQVRSPLSPRSFSESDCLIQNSYRLQRLLCIENHKRWKGKDKNDIL